MKYIYNDQSKQFTPIAFPVSQPVRFHYFKKMLESKARIDVDALKEHYGPNKFDIPIPQFFELFKEHMVAPFFVFQMFCVALWFLDEMWYYSMFTLVMLFVFESTVIMQVSL